MLSFCLIALSALSLPPTTPDTFWAHWGDGKAELSSYKLTSPRYGEPRVGYAVMIFVTEDISRTTRIKVESDEIPKSDRVPVLKLNRVVKFTTGIYDYSIMTSTFSSVESELGRPPFEPMKISLSVQEWCGHVFQMVVPQKHALDMTLHSYFQREGDQQRRLHIPAAAAYEDNLPIWIRELKGEIMQAGERRDLHILPALWHSRAQHAGADFQPGWIKKEDGGVLPVLGARAETWKWTWQVGDRTESYWVEKSAPHRIVKFSSSDGTAGDIVRSLRLPYWRLHGNDDLHYRDELNVPR